MILAIMSWVNFGNVGKNGYNADAAEGEDGNDLVVVAGIEIYVSLGQVHQRRDLGNIAAGFLYADDIVTGAGQLRRGGGFNVETGSALHIVKNDGQVSSWRSGIMGWISPSGLPLL